MMYRFKSKSSADLIMMERVGDQMLRIIGRKPSPQGIIEAAALPAAIAAVERAVTASEEHPDNAPDAGDDEKDAARHERIGLRQRAWPFLEMMKRARAEGHDVVWGV
jgi:hypothetical protein